MMSLVAYGSSDESGNESEIETESEGLDKVSPDGVSEETKTAATQSKQDVVLSEDDKPSVSVPDGGDNELVSNGSGLLSKLPVPKMQSSLDLQDSVLPLRKDNAKATKRGPVKITIPSLSEFADDDEPRPKKKIQPSAKGSGLFALLPPPKHLSVKEIKRSLVPHAVTRKPNAAPPVKKPPSKTPVKPLTKPSSLTGHADSDPESDGDGDFFSLNKEDTVPDIPVEALPVSVGGVDTELSSHSITSSHSEALAAAYHSTPPGYQNSYEDASSSHQYQDQRPSATGTEPSYIGAPEPQADSGQDYISLSGEDLQLDEEALQRLCGRQGRRRREEVQLLDVSGKDIMPDQREWLTKQLTQEQPHRSSSRNKFSGPSQQERRKHQITYLAHVAKENELELKNSWANNRQTRKQTQSKYGF